MAEQSSLYTGEQLPELPYETCTPPGAAPQTSSHSQETQRTIDFFGQYIEGRQSRGETTSLQVTPDGIFDFEVAEQIDLLSPRAREVEGYPTMFIHGALAISPDNPEPDAGVLRSIDNLYRAAEYDGPIELQIWGNSRPEKDAAGNTINTAAEDAEFARVATMIDRHLQEGNKQGLVQTRIAHTYSNKHLVDVRSDGMDWLIYNDRHHDNLSGSVWAWFDMADLTFMSRTALYDLYDALAIKRYAHFVKANLHFTADECETPLTERDDAEKIAIIYSMTRRLIERNLGPLDERGWYEDECTFAGLVDDYVRLGGVDRTSETMGESKSLLQRGKEALTFPPGKPLLYHVDSARVGTSYRRQHLLARTHRAIDLHSLDGQPNYQTYHELTEQGEAQPLRQDPVTPEELWEMIGEICLSQEQKTGTSLTSAQRQYLSHLIKRCMFNKDVFDQGTFAT
jgi:hypothetical protein